MYKIGFFYHFPSTYTTENELVLCLSNNGFQFYLVNRKLLPRKWTKKNTAYYKLSLPVLCQTDKYHVAEIHFLHDFPIFSDKRDNENFYFVADNTFEKMPMLLLDNESIFEYISNYKEKAIAQLLINCTVAQKQISSISKHLIYESYKDLKGKKEKILWNFKKHIESYNLEKILSSLYVRVWEHYRSKIGDDDYYNIYREGKLLDDSILVDKYIEEIIGLGKQCIYEDYGYTSQLQIHAKDFLEQHPIGIYHGDILEKEKQRIMAMYSKEDHMAYLFFDLMSEQHKLSQLLLKWKKFLEETEITLNKKFSIEKLSSMHQGFFYSFSKHGNHTELLIKINKYVYGLQNLPIIKIIISGDTPLLKTPQKQGLPFLIKNTQLEKKYYAKISEIIESLSKKHFVTIITSDAEGTETIARRCAENNIIEIISDKTWMKMKEEEKAYSMAKMADIIFLIT